MARLTTLVSGALSKELAEGLGGAAKKEVNPK